ncbi:hypothetical protein BD779DRAFT_1516154 [Infundibulicybe gibba]|nr:hypothetical protein BD779DRAFT_1558720 [Infundibulicybe gibba]KAF8890633.1 hypothetical protein BD779DRAFT_1516154 [Infundibulicybe gibba]
MSLGENTCNIGCGMYVSSASLAHENPTDSRNMAYMRHNTSIYMGQCPAMPSGSLSWGTFASLLSCACSRRIFGHFVNGESTGKSNVEQTVDVEITDSLDSLCTSPDCDAQQTMLITITQRGRRVFDPLPGPPQALHFRRLH